MGIEGGEHSPLPRTHIEASEPEVVLLGFHQHRVIHIKLQLIRVARNEPGVGRDTGSCIHQGPLEPAVRESGQGAVPEDGPVGLLSLLSVHHTGEKPEGLCA